MSFTPTALVHDNDGSWGVKVPQDVDTVVLDTSTLIADPDALFAFADLDVVVPLTVLEELDELKTRPDEVGFNARAAVRHLEALRATGDVGATELAPLPSGARVRIEVNGLHTERLEELHLSLNKPDNRILASVSGIAHNGSHPVLVSTDAALRVKAAALDLKAMGYTRHTPSTPHSMRVVDVDQAQVVSDVYEHGSVPLDVLDVTAGPNTPLVIRCGSSSVLAKVKGTDAVRINTKLSAWGLTPRSKEQSFALDALFDPDVSVVSLEGHAGTGKTLLALAAALEQTFEKSYERYSRVMVLRPVVAVARQELGYLPGDRDDKLGPWFDAVVDAMVALGDDVSHRQAKAMLDGWVHDGQLTMDAVTYLRGRSLTSTFVIVDECQNLEPSTAKTILTRLGEGSKVVLIGDVTQVDSPFLTPTTNALAALRSVFDDSDLFAHLTLTRGERSKVADLAAARL